MDDLDFSRHVPATQEGPALPQLYHRTVSAASGFDIPNLSGAISNYAESSNWMSSIGSSIAGAASNQMAQRLGSEIGKNPKGNIGLPITDFDKTMQQSYEAQSATTLGLQASKLISDSNLATANATRITPDLISKTNSSISLGLKNIFKNAPTTIQPELERQYGNLQLSQHADLTDRMIREQKEDQRNQGVLATDANSEHAYSFGIRGNEKAGESVIEATKRINQANLNARLITPDEAKTNIDTVRKSFRSGQIANQYEIARSTGKGEEFLKNVADGKYIKTDDPDYKPVTDNLLQYVNHQDSLRAQNENLRLTQFQTDVSMNPLAAGSKLQELKSNVSPENFAKAQLHYVDALKTYYKDQGDVTNALTSWNDPSSFARLSEKSINRGFDMQVGGYIKQQQQQGNPITQEDAEVQVAASAGGKVPVFEKSLENKLLNGNPANIASASNQIALLDSMKAGRVYAGISPKAKAIAIQFNAQRGSMPDNELARKITDNLSNIDDTMQKTLDNSWGLILSTGGASGPGAVNSLGNFALKEVGMNKDDFGNGYFNTIYGNDVYNNLNSNFITARGDYDTAKKMTKDYVDEHYGDTFINGARQKTDSPVEKYLGYNGNRDITPFIQQDLINHLSESFVKAKKSNPNDYWETLPLNNGVAEAVRHIKTKDGVKDYRYPINLIGHAGNQWDVVADTPYGPRSLFLVAPQLGVTTYQPNKDAIVNNYKAHLKSISHIGRI